MLVTQARAGRPLAQSTLDEIYSWLEVSLLRFSKIEKKRQRGWLTFFFPLPSDPQEPELADCLQHRVLSLGHDHPQACGEVTGWGCGLLRSHPVLILWILFDCHNPPA